MAKAILIILTVILFIGGFGMVGYSLFSTVSLLPKLSNSTDNMGELHGHHLVRIIDLYYHDPRIEPNATDICYTLDDKQFVILEIEYDPGKITDFCEVMIDNRVEKRIRMFDVDCLRNCTDVQLAIDISQQNFRNDHKIEICCQNMCRSQVLKKLC